MNPSLSSDQIEKLAKHKDVWVRLGIARNTNTPQEMRKGILEGFLKLKSDENEGDIYLIRCELTPPEMIDEVLERYLPLKSTNREDRLSYIARNPNTRPETLAKLAGDRFTEVRIAVAKNPNTPVETLRQLSQ
jgi:hypothetical protein